MQTQLDNNMNAEQIQNWTLVSFCTALFNAVYNVLRSGWQVVEAWGVNEWVAVLGVLGMVFSLLMQRHYNRRRDQREAEQHEWQRKAYAAKLLEQEAD